ncbi:helix-turn-helix transcriptional regulator [Limosilactobacillus reuteri]|uniref:helix-turn-helix transcriptional regulator n=1 Tax=Limosilactobacillus reuteri TaxID=1598 RepID=UPI001C0FE649|nr:helix-turn-helix transcriptional regulator [Limosilactobacillus reuteri]MBU5283835.1 helix-turn-helix transcriptional regulator [Limosilactobacillus reuteri]MCC4395543.1 helix-turn-helix transcriptional regulator [Limosilactobacillus reuteri]MCC4401404.1 helix-turn-helix transcriptional regulator [Limosilactobacillus reuteri]
MNNVRKYRKQQKLSQLELAKEIGVARQTINLIENDKSTLGLCLNLAHVLHTDLNSLFWKES